MPTIPTHVGRLRRTIWIVALALVVLSAFVFVRLGSILLKEDPLQPSDAVFVLAGSQMDRPLEAADLYRARVAGMIVLSVDQLDGGARFVNAQGIHYPTGAELARDTLVKLGIPPDAILISQVIHDNTAHEAHTLRSLAKERGWTRVIVVTSKYHTRRAGFAMRRELKGAGVDVVMRASRYDRFDAVQWWRSRSDIRMVLFETPKLVAYLLGLGE